MTDIKDLKIYIVEYNHKFIQPLKLTFSFEKNIEVIEDDLVNFVNNNRDKIDCIVSPANSFGQLTGGFDLAIAKSFKCDIQKYVDEYIKDNFYGEQVVGSSFYIKPNDDTLSLIHTPTMTVPSKIIDYQLIYHCMRSTLICALKNDVKSIIIPVFGGECGCVPINDAARYMYKAYKQIALASN